MTSKSKSGHLKIMSLFRRGSFFLCLFLICAFFYSALQAQEDPAYPFKTLQNDLDQGNYQNILSHFSVYQAQCGSDGDNRNLKHYYEKLGAWENHLALKKWTGIDGSSCVPWTAMAFACLGKGAEYRGNGDEDKVAVEDLKTFKQYLDVASFCLAAAVKLGQADPYPYVFTLEVEVDRACLEKSVMQDYLDKALAISPNNYDALNVMARYHSPMWCGSEQEMASFIKTYVSSRPPGSYSRLIIVRYFQEVWISRKFDPKFLHDGKVWNAINSEFSTFFKYHPENVYYRSAYAFWACHFNHFYIAKTQFDISGDQWDSNLWTSHEVELGAKKDVEDWVAAHPQH